MKFKKYQCLGNDFIIFEDIVLNVKQLCDNHYISADGLIIIQNDNILFFNKDGSKAKFCGNGIRCAAKYINDHYNENIKFTFENKEYNVTHYNDLYTLKMQIPKYKKIKKYFIVDNVVNHLVVLDEPNLKKARKLFNKYNMNITFYYNNNAKTYEKGVGFTKGCGSGLISIMSVLYKEFNITNKEIYSDDQLSKLEVRHNFIHLESEVTYIYKGEI